MGSHNAWSIIELHTILYILCFELSVIIVVNTDRHTTIELVYRLRCHYLKNLKLKSLELGNVGRTITFREARHERQRDLTDRGLDIKLESAGLYHRRAFSNGTQACPWLAASK